MFGYYPKDSAKTDVLWRIDSTVEFVADCATPLLQAAMSKDPNMDEIYKKSVGNFLKIMDARLSKNPAGCPFAAGTKDPTIADFAVVSFLQSWIMNPNNPYKEQLAWGAKEGTSLATFRA